MRYKTLAATLVIPMFGFLLSAFAQDESTAKKKIDVWVDTDLGGDPDDIQSLFRLVHYSDVLNVRGIVSTPCNDKAGHPWDTIPQDQLIREWIRRIDPDHLRRQGYTSLMRERELLKVVWRGSQQVGPPDPGRRSEGSTRLGAVASEYSTSNPLWVLVWGSLTTVAQALHDDPSIAPKIRLYYVGSTNTLHDSLARSYVYDFMARRYPQLWWIENAILPRGSHETFRGVYNGGIQDGEWGNREFVTRNIRGKGSTRNGTFAERCGDVFPVATSPAGTLKEGDSPSILYVVSNRVGGVGNPDDPTGESWGGSFRKADAERFPNYYVDLDKSPQECQATINKWRVQFLSDWKKRWLWYEFRNKK